MASSRYIRAMHPKTSIRPDPDSVQRALSLGWIAQLKIHGHRAQIHIPASQDEEVLAYTRHGTHHKMKIPAKMESELRRLYTPKKGWNIIDAEWLKPEKKLFVFDFLQKEGKVLRHLTFLDRWKMLPKDFISPHISTLSVIKDFSGCMKALSSTKPHIEGLVFKSPKSTGFSDTSILRCRKR